MALRKRIQLAKEERKDEKQFRKKIYISECDVESCNAFDKKKGGRSFCFVELAIWIMRLQF